MEKCGLFQVFKVVFNVVRMCERKITRTEELTARVRCASMWFEYKNTFLRGAAYRQD